MINAPAALLAFSVILLLVHIFLQAFLATKDLGRQWNASARDGDEKPHSVLAGRAARASANFKETYPAFLAFMIMAQLQPVNIMLIVAGGLIWTISRIIYLPLYLSGIPYIRSLIWLCSIAGLGIMLSALFF